MSSADQLKSVRREARWRGRKECVERTWFHFFDQAPVWGPGLGAGGAGGSAAIKWPTGVTVAAGVVRAVLAAFQKYDAHDREEFHRTKNLAYAKLGRELKARTRSATPVSDHQLTKFNDRITSIEANKSRGVARPE
jgi:hypothetical protein